MSDEPDQGERIGVYHGAPFGFSSEVMTQCNGGGTLVHCGLAGRYNATGQEADRKRRFESRKPPEIVGDPLAAATDLLRHRPGRQRLQHQLGWSTLRRRKLDSDRAAEGLHVSGVVDPQDDVVDACRAASPAESRMLAVPAPLSSLARLAEKSSTAHSASVIGPS